MTAVLPGRRRAAIIAVPALAGLVLVLLVGGAVMSSLAGQLSSGRLGGIGLVVVILTVAAVGLVVARHQPGNPAGWLLVTVALCFEAALAGGSYTKLVFTAGHRGLPLGLAAFGLNALWGVAIILFALVILLFPDGRLPSARWKWFMWICVAVAALLPAVTVIDLAAAMAGHHAQVTSGGRLATPTLAWLSPAQTAGTAAIVALWLGAIARQALSWRRSAGDRRQQLKWLMSGALIVALIGVPSLGISSAIWEIGIFGLTALPVAIGVGILKYRLYDIDRIISRTLAYAVVTGLLVGVYAGLVLLATRVLPLSSSVAVAAATLAAAALFNPLRRRVQALVDRRFNRARYDADQMVAAFSARLQDVTDLDGVRADLLGTVRQALEPAHASLWLGGGER
ncbi:MAG TPA: hypothetical protein VIX86_22765 [Streptosporangiaceae bacterium]